MNLAGRTNGGYYERKSSDSEGDQGFSSACCASGTPWQRLDLCLQHADRTPSTSVSMPTPLSVRHQRPVASTVSSSSNMAAMPTIASTTTTANSTSTSVAGNNGIATTASVSLQTEEMTARELHSLSKEDRQMLYEEVHGVQGVLEETDELLQTALPRLEHELSRIQKKDAYELATFLRPSFVEDVQLRLSFLRSTRFNANEAAIKMVEFMEFKLKLFGVGKLVKTITLQDLDADDMEAMQSGSLQLLPKTDQSGRALWCVFQKHQVYKRPINLIRSYYYLFMSNVENIDTQRKGFVLILYNHGKGNGTKMFDPELNREARPIASCLPTRAGAMHYCFDDSKLKYAMSLVQLAVGISGRIRFRGHYGSAMENHYHLLTYGIDPSQIPVDQFGNIQLSNFHQWLQRRQQIEQASIATTETIPVTSTPIDDHMDIDMDDTANNGRILWPASADVLFGKSKPCLEFPGNLQMLRLVEESYNAHQGSNDRSKKAHITRQIVEKIRDAGGRFLKRGESNGMNAAWIEVSDEDARAKVSHTFRNLKQSRLRISRKMR